MSIEERRNYSYTLLSTKQNNTITQLLNGNFQFFLALVTGSKISPVAYSDSHCGTVGCGNGWATRFTAN